MTVTGSGEDGQACRQFDGDQASCEQAWNIGGDGIPVSCFYDDDGDCRGCGRNNQEDDDCINACLTCDRDPSRTVFAGNPDSESCRQFDDQDRARFIPLAGLRPEDYAEAEAAPDTGRGVGYYVTFVLVFCGVSVIGVTLILATLHA